MGIQFPIFFCYHYRMKEEIFKIKFEKFSCTTHHDSLPITYAQEKNSRLLDFATLIDESIDNIPLIKKQPLFFTEDQTFFTEEEYLKNYGNPLCKVSKSYVMIVVERDGDKICQKFFWGFRERQPGKVWFKISKNVDYITVNTKTGDVYTGHLHNYQKKRKAVSKIRKNYFANEPIGSYKLRLRNILVGFINNHLDVIMESVSKFMYEIDKREDFENLDFEKRLFRFYLNKKNIKYPNNFHLYSRELIGPWIRKSLKNCDNRLVEGFMKHNGLTGNKLKQALHNCSSLNIGLYTMTKKLFGDDWINQEPFFILNILNSDNRWGGVSIPSDFGNVIGKDELKRVFKLFKRVYFDGVLDSSSFHDHIRMYTELKMYGETDLRWMSDGDVKNYFRKEHMDWSDKIQFYKKGHYDRTYPLHMYEVIERPIGDYYPILLDNSINYNEESFSQSNCVKTYIGRPSSIIISLRNLSDERATLEYKVFNEGNKIRCLRVQSLGKHNSNLVESWNESLLKLDERLLSFFEDNKLQTVKLTKTCVNGTILESDSEWDDSGNLRWTFRAIEMSNETIFNWI